MLLLLYFPTVLFVVYCVANVMVQGTSLSVGKGQQSPACAEGVWTGAIQRCCFKKPRITNCLNRAHVGAQGSKRIWGRRGSFWLALTDQVQGPLQFIQKGNIKQFAYAGTCVIFKDAKRTQLHANNRRESEGCIAIHLSAECTSSNT